MEFEVLGPVRLRADGGAVALSGRLQRTLLGLLLARANQPVSVDVLTDALWDGSPHDRAESKLQVHVHRLRRALAEPDRLAFGPGGYRLTVLPDELDADRFDSLVDEATQLGEHDPARVVELVRKALDLWRGDPYEGLDVPELAAEARRLSDRRLAALEELYQAELAAGRETAVVADLTDLVRKHPLRERFHGLRMVALYRSGRQADALQAYQDARRTLVDELGLEPGPELRSIEQRILAGEPVTLGPAAAARVAPAQLPVGVQGFVGRDAELAELDALLTDVAESTVIATVSGTAGVGKTALTVAWAHCVRDRFPDGQLYVDLRGYGSQAPLSPGQVLGGFLRALGVDGTAIPTEVEERASRFRTLVDGRRILVVLDNARTADQVRPLLPGSASCLAIVTSRDSLTGLGVREGARRLILDRMSTVEADLLMSDLLGDVVDDDPNAVGQLIDHCARLPLALRIAADLVLTRPARGVAGLVAELADERHRLDVLDVGDDSRVAVRAVFSWSYQRLAPETARLFRMCGLHPGHDFDVYALAALADVDLRVARRSLDTLVRAHLVDERADGRLQPHDLLRAYARELVESTDDEGERRAAWARLADNYLRAAVTAMNLVAPRETKPQPVLATEPRATPAFADDDAALIWLDSERSNLLAVVTHDPAGYAVPMSSLLWRYLSIGDHGDDATTLHTAAVRAAREQKATAAEAEALRLLSNTLRDRGQHAVAAQHAEQALALFVELDEPRKEAATLNSLGGICDVAGQLRDAVRHYQDALDIYRELGLPALFGPLINLADTQGRLGNYDVAFDLARQGEAQATEVGDRSQRAHTLCVLARLSEQSGRLKDAFDYVQQLLTMVRDGGVRSYEDDALNLLGDVHRGRGDYESSVRCHVSALAVSRRNGNSSTMAEALIGAGQARRLNGDLDAAVNDLEEARQLAADHGFRYEEARAFAALGDACADVGRHDDAREHWQRALVIFESLQLPEAAAVRGKLEE